jgi:hypothetical protein
MSGVNDPLHPGPLSPNVLGPFHGGPNFMAFGSPQPGKSILLSQLLAEALRSATEKSGGSNAGRR